MYEELMVLWKDRCSWLVGSAVLYKQESTFTGRLMYLGFYLPGYPVDTYHTKVGEYVFFMDDSRVPVASRLGASCLVGGVMLFTWEQGIA